MGQAIQYLFGMNCAANSIGVMNMIRRIICKVSILVIISLALFAASTWMPKPMQDTGAVFCGSFIQYWYAKDWDEAGWTEELSALKAAGIEELIVQNIADTKKRYAVYPTKIKGYTCNGVDMVGNALKAAEKVGIKVRLGLGFSDDWWFKNAMDKSWLTQEANDNKEIFNEVAEKYGFYPSLGGWYIPYEFYQFTAINRIYQSNLNSFLKEIASEIKSKSKKDIMISPFYNSNYSWVMPLKGWSKLVENALKNTDIDILALQDGVGAKNNTIKQLDSLFAYTKYSTDKLGVKLYGNVETFDSTLQGNIPASKERISSQLLIQRPYVEKFVAFSLNHYQSNRIDSEQLVSFINYLGESLFTSKQTR